MSNIWTTPLVRQEADKGWRARRLVQRREDRANHQNRFLYEFTGRTPNMAVHPVLFLSSFLVILWADWGDFVVRQLPACYDLSDVVEASIWCIKKLLGIKTLPRGISENKLPIHCRRNFPVSKHLGWRFQITCSKIFLGIFFFFFKVLLLAEEPPEKPPKDDTHSSGPWSYISL